jgi:uncharacterized protein (TIGR03067 family)
MSTLGWVVLGAVLASGGGKGENQEAIDADAERLKGEWVAVAAVRQGKELPREETAKIRLVFTGPKDGVLKSYRVQLAAPLLPPDAPVDGWGEPYGLRPEKTPKQIWLQKQNGARYSYHPGIYELKGDTLQLCINLEAWGNWLTRRSQPTAFAAPRGSGLTLVRLKRKG